MRSRNQNGHHLCTPCMSTRQGQVAGRSGLLSEKEKLQGPSLIRGLLGGNATLYTGKEHLDCENHFIRISLSNSKYQVIKSTIGLGAWIMYQQRYLGKSEKGVYYASVDDGLLRVWILTESSGQMEWVLKLNNLDIRSHCYDRQAHGPWVLQDVNYEYYFPDDEKKKQVE